MLRKYILGSQRKEDGTIDWYVLIFRKNGRMLVVKSPNADPLSQPDKAVHITPENFKDHTVNGVPLATLVVMKLTEILPESN